MSSVCLAYNPYGDIRPTFFNMLKNLVRSYRMPAYSSVYQRMPACLKRIQPMPNLPLAYVSVYQRISETFIRNSYVSLIRNSATGPLTRQETAYKQKIPFYFVLLYVNHKYGTLFYYIPYSLLKHNSQYKHRRVIFSVILYVGYKTTFHTSIPYILC